MTEVNDHTALLQGKSWNGFAGNTPSVITFSFNTTAEAYVNETSYGYDPGAAASFEAFNATEKTAARDALNAWAAVSGIHFVEVASGGEITFNKISLALSPNPGSGGYTTSPNRGFGISGVSPPLDEGGIFDGDIYIESGATPTGVSLAYTLLHEIGHAIGLKHSFEGDPTLPSGHTTAQTVMQYGAAVAVLGTLDDDAAQAIYGPPTAPANTLLSFSYNATTKVLTQNWGSNSNVVMGTGQKDLIDAGAGADYMGGFANNDTLFGGTGNDVMHGGAGDDILAPGPDDDYVYGGTNVNLSGNLNPGSDTAWYGNATESIVVQLRFYWNDSGYQAVGIDIGNDLLYDIDNVTGGTGWDTITGNQYANALAGGGGRDTLSGTLGKDKLTGGGDNDLLIGGWDKDSLSGGAGRDRFDFDSKEDVGTGGNRDVIGDFKRGQDRIDLRGIDANLIALDDQRFTWIAKQAFHHRKGELHYVKVGANVIVEGDIDGNGRADFQLQVNKLAALGAADFYL